MKPSRSRKISRTWSKFPSGQELTFRDDERVRRSQFRGVGETERLSFRRRRGTHTHTPLKKNEGRAPSAGKLGIYGSVATSVFTRRDALPPLEKSKVRAPRETTWILFLDYTPTLDLRGYIANKRIVLLLLLCFAIFSFFFLCCAEMLVCYNCV